jgi:predicted MPP superfamily phosphohydrolase
MLPWIDTLKKIKEHKYGKYSVPGNHDYGEYVTWPTEIEKKKIFNRLKNYMVKLIFSCY